MALCLSELRRPRAICAGTHIEKAEPFGIRFFYRNGKGDLGLFEGMKAERDVIVLHRGPVPVPGGGGADEGGILNPRSG